MKVILIYCYSNEARKTTKLNVLRFTPYVLISVGEKAGKKLWAA